jgi:phage-related protein
MASLGNLTNKVASKVGSAAVSATKTVGGVAGSIAAGTYNTVKQGFMNATDIHKVLNPRSMVGDALDSVGLGAIMPAFGKDPRKNEAVQAAQRVADQNKATGTSFKPMEELLNKLININEKILENSNALIDYAKKQTNLLDTSNELVKKQTLQDIENMREAKKPTSANDNKVGAAPANDNKKSGGFLDGIMDSVKGILSSLGPIGSFLSSVGSIFAKLARFVMTLNPLMLVVLAAIASLHMEDFAKMFDNLAKVFDDLANGKIFDGIIRFFATFADLALKAIGRLVANILDFLGADGWAKDLNNFLDKFNFADMAIEWFHAATDWLSNFGEHLKEFGEWAKKKLVDVWDTVVDGITSFWQGIKNFGKTIVDYVKKIPELASAAWNWIVSGIESVWKSIKDFGTMIADFAKKIPELASAAWNWVVDGVESVWEGIKDFGTMILDYAKEIVKMASDAWTNVENAFASIWNGIKDFSKIILDYAKEIVKMGSDAWEYISNAFTSIWDGVKEISQSIIDKFSSAVKSFTEFWDSFSIIDIVLTPFNYLKDTATTLFDNLQKEIANILSFDLVGKISESVGSVINSVWNFFKALPAKAMDLISDVLPDSLKGFFKSMFGSSETVAPTAPVTRSSEARPALTPRNMGLAIQDSSVNASPSDRNQQFNQQSAQMVASQSAPPPPVIINNSTNTNTGGGGGQGARTSGAVHTAPQSSHIDRALYGDFYGAGVP